MCNSIKFESSWNLPPVLKTVQKAGRGLGTRLLKTASTAHAVVAKHVTGYSILVCVNDFDLTTGFYWSHTLLLKRWSKCKRELC